MDFLNKLLAFVSKNLPFVFDIINKIATNRLANSTDARPNTYSLWRPIGSQYDKPANYLSWHSVTNKDFFDLHLGPASSEYIESLPENSMIDGEHGQITKLFARGGNFKESRSTVFFMFFAQWFTDGFFRSDIFRGELTTSNHNIDLCQIYGANEAAEKALRTGTDGKLKSQQIDGEEYPVFLGTLDENGTWKVKPEFTDLPYIKSYKVFDAIYGQLPDSEKDKLLATGLERGNGILGHNVISTIFLREHNSICDLLKSNEAYASWDDDRLFHTARVINTIILMKLVIEDYVNHIAGLNVLKCDPSFAEDQKWYREPWISAEFNLLYRWHGLVPDSFIVEGESHPFIQNHDLLLSKGLSRLVNEASAQAAGEISLQNIPDFLMHAEAEMIRKGRQWHLQSFNAYRKKFGLKPLTSFKQLARNDFLANKLEELYGDIDRLEFTVGLFAEESDGRRLTGELLTTIVAYDAITQIYTNPIFAHKHFNEEYFTPEGIKRFENTDSFQDLVSRNSRSAVSANFSRYTPTKMDVS